MRMCGPGAVDDVFITETLAGIRPVFRNRTGGFVKGNSGRFTAPTIEASQSLCRVIWSDAWQDGELSPVEEERISLCDRVVSLATIADLTEQARNAIGHRDGLESPHADRRLREIREQLRVIRGGLDDPTPAGPSAARSVKQRAA